MKAHGFQGLVMLASCDKIIPGMLMAAVRLNLPTLFLTAGAMLPCPQGDRTVVTSDLKEAIGKRRDEKIDQETFLEWQESICASPGACSMMGTANTMGCFLEAVGLAPFGSATMLSFASQKIRQARDVGEQIVNLTREDGGFNRFFTWDHLENGIKYISASGGSTNAVLHLMAISTLMNAASDPVGGHGVNLDLEEFSRIQASTPVVAKFKPSSEFNLEDFHRVGGVRTVLKTIRDKPTRNFPWPQEGP